MNLAFSLPSGIASVLGSSAAPSQAARDLQLASGGGSDVARDRIVRNDQRSRALRLTGARVGTKRVLDQAGVTKPAAARRM